MSTEIPRIFVPPTNRTLRGTASGARSRAGVLKWGANWGFGSTRRFFEVNLAFQREKRLALQAPVQGCNGGLSHLLFTAV